MRDPRPSRYRQKPNTANGATAARLRVLAQWRGVDLTAEEKALAATAKPITSVMPNVLKGLGLDKRRVEAELARVWNHLIDPEIVAHAQPLRLHKGTLFVSVDSSVWLNEIVRYRRREILQRLQSSFGSDLVVRISFRVG